MQCSGKPSIRQVSLNVEIALRGAEWPLRFLGQRLCWAAGRQGESRVGLRRCWVSDRKMQCFLTGPRERPGAKMPEDGEEQWFVTGS